MKISVFGLGYVGCVSAACLAARGHEVIGVDSNPAKAAAIAAGQSPIVEEGIAELLAEQVASGRLRTSSDAASAVRASDISLICVGTPSAPDGSLATTYLERVAQEIGEAIGAKDSRHVVVFRSTMLPGTCEGLLIPILERTSGKHVVVDFGVCVNPEYLREGTSIRDFNDPPKTVVGESDPISGDAVRALYEGLPGPRFSVPIRVAEMTKYVDNSFHALKVGFANEIGAICGEIGLDSHEVMDIFLADTKLNISTAYLRPGFAFGGSCLPKDLRALLSVARRTAVDVPILEHILPSNERHVRRTLDAILRSGRKRVGMLGLAFKAGTDDLRESPMVELAERLLGKGYDLRIFDDNVRVSRLTGANRDYLETHLPHIDQILVESAEEVVEHAEILIAGSRDAMVIDLIDGSDDADRLLIDLVRLPDAEARRGEENYVGVAW